MKRRTFLLACALALPPAARAQRAPPRIGFLIAGAREGYGERIEAFRAGLRELGYLEGKNVAFEWRFAEGRYERLEGLAEELVRAKVDVIVATSTPGTRAAQRATRTTPIVAAVMADPLRDGFAATLARPGGNVTGLSNATNDATPKQIDYLKALLPRLSRVALLLNPDNSAHEQVERNTERAARQAGVGLLVVKARTAEAIDAAFDAAHGQGAGALLVAADGFFFAEMERFTALMLKLRLPVITAYAECVAAGGLMSYGRDANEAYRRVALYVDKILKGARPGDLPIEQPTRFDLAINLRTAAKLGLRVPREILVRADRVIE